MAITESALVDTAMTTQQIGAVVDAEGEGAGSMDNSQSTTDGLDGLDGISTPPTSHSRSSQEQLHEAPEMRPAAAAASRSRSLSSEEASQASSAGQKRTADGQIKQSSTSPKMKMRSKHNRNASLVSNASSSASRMGELSSELRTRLSYAMVKVNHGWQANSIDEVETLASQVASPTSSTSTLHARRLYPASPRATMAVLQGNTPRQSFPSTSNFDLEPHPRGDMVTNRTYESFWRDHPVNTMQNASSTTPPPFQSSHAPLSDVRPALYSRRSDPHTPTLRDPPSLPTDTYSAPRTPLRPQSGGHLHAQKTLQEQDAIETLLFMSSPGHSAKFAANRMASSGPAAGSPPPSTAPAAATPHPQQQSPLRTVVYPQMSSTGGSTEGSSSRPGSRHGVSSIADGGGALGLGPGAHASSGRPDVVPMPRRRLMDVKFWGRSDGGGGSGSGASGRASLTRDKATFERVLDEMDRVAVVAARGGGGTNGVGGGGGDGDGYVSSDEEDVILYPNPRAASGEIIFGR